MGDHCFACGKRVEPGNFCSNCGVDLSPANRRHHLIMRSYEDTAREAIKKAKRDRETYDEFLDTATDEYVVSRAVEALGEREGMWVKLLEDIAFERL